MVKCLVTKLQGVVNNPNLLKIGEMPIYVKSSASTNAKEYKLSIQTQKDTVIKIVGDGYFTDASLSANNGKEQEILANTTTDLYFSNGDYKAVISDKYNILQFSLANDNSKAHNNISVNLDDFMFSANLKTLTLSNSDSFGNIESLYNKSKLANVFLLNTNVRGNANGLNVNNLLNFDLCVNNIEYDISNLKNTTNLNLVSFANTTLQSGNISSLANNRNIKRIGDLGKGLSGDISVLSNFKALVQNTIRNYSNNITGDIGKIPDCIVFFISNVPKEYTYSKGSRTVILSVSNVKLSNIDTFLNDMAGLSASSNYKVLTLIGTRTSASDAAVQTLQSKGYTVSITPA